MPGLSWIWRASPFGGCRQGLVCGISRLLHELLRIPPRMTFIVAILLILFRISFDVVLQFFDLVVVRVPGVFSNGHLSGRSVNRRRARITWCACGTEAPACPILTHPFL